MIIWKDSGETMKPLSRESEIDIRSKLANVIYAVHLLLNWNESLEISFEEIREKCQKALEELEEVI